jgi:hypothetical protein
MATSLVNPRSTTSIYYTMRCESWLYKPHTLEHPSRVPCEGLNISAIYTQWPDLFLRRWAIFPFRRRTREHELEINAIVVVASFGFCLSNQLLVRGLVGAFQPTDEEVSLTQRTIHREGSNEMGRLLRDCALRNDSLYQSNADTARATHRFVNLRLSTNLIRTLLFNLSEFLLDYGGFCTLWIRE